VGSILNCLGLMEYAACNDPRATLAASTRFGLIESAASTLTCPRCHPPEHKRHTSRNRISNMVD
jgi:hypothetical protein